MSLGRVQKVIFKVLKEEAEKKDKKDSSQDSATSTADRVKNSPRYAVPIIDKKGSYAQGK